MLYALRKTTFDRIQLEKFLIKNKKETGPYNYDVPEEGARGIRGESRPIVIVLGEGSRNTSHF